MDEHDPRPSIEAVAAALAEDARLGHARSAWRQRPCQTGGRFSANARGPSFASSVANTRSV